MLQTATFSLSAIGVLAATLAICATGFIGWQRNWSRHNLIGLFISILMLLGVLIAAGSEVNHAQGGVLRQSLTGLVYLLSFWFAIHAPDGSREIPVRMVPITLIGLLALTFISALWSAAPDVTIRRAIQFAGLTIFAVAAVRLFSNDELWRRYLNPLLLWLLAALVVAPFFPDFAFDINGNFRGLSAHKNSWAGIALAATIITGLQLKRRPRSTYLWAALGLSLLTVLLTRSATAISLAMATLAIGIVFATSQSGQATLKAALIAGLMLLVAIPFVYLLITGESPLEAAFTQYFNTLQKESTLTGRNVVWATILEHAWLSPWLGHGYGAFWIGDSGPSVAVVAGLNWQPVHSHNGYVDLFNDLGAVGLISFTLVVIQHLNNIVITWLYGSRDSAAFHFVVLLAILGYNLSESSILLATHALWVVLVVSIIDAHRQSKTGETSD